MAEQFVSEAIRPVAGTADVGAMATGAPGLPRAFTWRGRTVTIERVVRTWRETGPCRNGSAEAYVRKHGFEVLTDAGERMTLYFDRQARSGTRPKARWWLLSVGTGTCPRSG